MRRASIGDGLTDAVARGDALGAERDGRADRLSCPGLAG